ncbi:DUF6917 domain-containing protein [Streptomonospora litoralis]|uniref:DUF6917 domain-containing protein n=1 Tax=Streptomonospora litoralis TaxID=2498135 RepID=A0A4P6Q4B3_9ACTN|nr:hypothetical protein [Streptomonospora litoralis]QBI55536.1 hypothetical protein EKD16_18865 [Streptomonospora litoralis]
MIGEDGPKRVTTAALVKVLVHRREERGMELLPYASRCVRTGEVHELVATDHTATEPGARIDRVAFLGFAEIGCAGVVDRGDELRVNGRPVGTVLGFDGCHFPNHYNILVHTRNPLTGAELGLRPEDRIEFAAVHGDTGRPIASAPEGRGGGVR